ncbi:fungal-specific transcription factor domain-containing protein [Dipodascopsis uninucleata]
MVRVNSSNTTSASSAHARETSDSSIESPGNSVTTSSSAGGTSLGQSSTSSVLSQTSANGSRSNSVSNSALIANLTSHLGHTPTTAELRKLKRRVDPSKRKRIALACDSCKRRKQKCNGAHPCSICQKKNFVCHYTPTRADILPLTASASQSSNTAVTISAIESSPSLSPKFATVTELQSTHSPEPSNSSVDASVTIPISNTASDIDVHMSGVENLDSNERKRDRSRSRNSLQRIRERESSQTRISVERANSYSIRAESSMSDSEDYAISPVTSLPSPEPNLNGSREKRSGHGYQSSVNDSVSHQEEPQQNDVSHIQQQQQQQQQQVRYRRKRSHSRSEYQVETVGDGRNTRLLWDAKGHLRYMGESGVLSFLEQSRKAFRKVMGDSTFTLDPAQFRFIDGPSHTASMIPIQLPPRAVMNELVQAFEDNIQASDYILDMDHFRYLVAQTYRNPMGAPKHWLCLLHFTCALGAIFVSSKQELDTEKLNIPPFSGITADNNGTPDSTSTGNQSRVSDNNLIDPAVFFESALGLMTDAHEDGELWVVQAYLLSSLYYQIICKRNASWIQLGSAIRFAQALGMHRKCVNMTFPKQQRIVRQRLWRTLYIHDRLWSSSLGRPLAIDDCDWDDRDTTDLAPLDRIVVEMSKLCEIIGDICILVYRPQSISSSTSQKLATRLREWSDGLPPDTQLSSMNLNHIDDRNSIGGLVSDEIKRQVIRNQTLLRLHLTHLNSIILLTRPFFLLMIAKSPSDLGQNQGLYKTISRLSSACVLCAARSVDLVMTFFAQNQQPIRSHLMTYFIFTAGIVLLLESFHQRRSEVESYITRGIFLCIFILGHYGKCDPSAKRYRNILQEMDRAARAARTINNDASKLASSAGAPNQNISQSAKVPKHISQINSLLNNGVLSPSGEPSFPFLPSPRNSSVRNEGNSRSNSLKQTSVSSASQSANGAGVSLGPQDDLSPPLPTDYDDEKYLNDMLSYKNVSSMGVGNSNHLSRLFLKAAANDGRYQIPESPGPVGASAIRAEDETGGVITMPSSIPTSQFMQPTDSKSTTSSSTMGNSLNISPADAMSQFLMDDTFAVGSSANMEFSFDLDMMDWINLASNPSVSQSASSLDGFDPTAEAVRRANAELFHGPGGSRQGQGAITTSTSKKPSVSNSTSLGNPPHRSGASGTSTVANRRQSSPQFYGHNDTVTFRGLMMNAEY